MYKAQAISHGTVGVCIQDTRVISLVALKQGPDIALAEREDKKKVHQRM